MSVPTPTSRVSYTGNGVTSVFSTSFYFLAASQLVVKLTPSGGSESVLTLGVHYTVSMPPSVGAAGSITMLVAPPNLASLVIERTVPFTQNTSFRTAGTFDRATHEDTVDEVVFQTQQLARRISDLESAGAPGAVVAGNGLSFSGSTLHVGAGAGLQANADTIEVVFGPATTAVFNGPGYDGVDPRAARADHGHGVAVGVPLALAVGAATDPGSGSGLALANHVHAVPAGVPVNVTKAANDAGGAPTFARSDHKHDVTTAAPVAITALTNAEGSASSLARSDHQHAHGVLSDETLHAVATLTTAGFMSAADKTKLANLPNELVSSGKVVTNNATPTTVLQFTPTDGQAEEIDLTVIGRQSGAVNAGGYRRKFTVSRFDGTTSLIGTVDTLGADKESTAGWDVSVTIASPDVIVQVTGAAATTVTWVARARRLQSV